MIPIKETEDVQFVMLFSTGALDRRVYDHQQLAFDLLEQHGVTYEIVDGSDSSNKVQRNRLWTMVTQEDREYPQFFLRKNDNYDDVDDDDDNGNDGDGDDNGRSAWEYFGDIGTLQVAATHWTLLKKLLRGKNAQEGECGVPPDTVPVKMIADSPVTVVMTTDAVAPKRITVTNGTKGYRCDRGERRHRSRKGAVEVNRAKRPSRGTGSEKVICVSHHANNSGGARAISWSVTDHLDKARASTARLDALIAQATKVRERTTLRPLKKTHGDRHPTKSNQPVPRGFVHRREEATPEKGRNGSVSSSSSTSASSSSSITATTEESDRRAETESRAVGDSQVPGSSRPNAEASHDEGNQSTPQEKQEAAKDKSDTERIQCMERALESGSDSSENNTVAASRKSDCTDKAQYSDVEQAFGCVAGLEDEGIQEIASKSSEEALLELSEETEEVDPLKDVIEHFAEARRNPASNEECESEPRYWHDDNDEFDREEQDELGDLAIGGFHESFKLPISKDTTETTEMESFSNFADSMGSLNSDLKPTSSKGEFIAYEEGTEDEEYDFEEVIVDDDEFEENMAAPIRKILVLIATQTIDRQVPFDQQNALATLEAHGIDYFTMDGSDPSVKEARDALFELSEVGPRYPQFFQVKGEEVTFLGDMEGLYDAIENKYLGEWLMASVVQ